MVLILEVSGPQAAQLGSACRKVFGVEGGLIGRDARNSWVLPHTKVSGRHARISFQNGVFYIEDNSTNGVFINGSKNRLGKGRTFALKSGDAIFIDPYPISVAVGSSDYVEPPARRYSPPPAPRYPSQPYDPYGADPFSDQSDGYGDRIVPTVDDPHAEPMAGHEVDPLKLLGGEDPARRQTPRKVPNAQDLERASPIHGHYQPPRVLTPTPPPTPPPEPRAPDNPFAIPEDYDPLAPATKYRIAAPPATPPPPRRPAPPPPAAHQAPAPIDLDDLAPPVASTAPAPVTAQSAPPAEVPAPDTPLDSLSTAEWVPLPPPVTPATPVPRPVTPPPVKPQPPLAATPSSSPRHAPAPAPPEEPAAPVPPAPVAATAPPSDALAVDLRSVLEGAGLDPEDVTDDLARDFGRILRVVVSGVMEVLQARHNVKDEFRMRVTQFRRVDNNPLKFSANVDDALHNLLVKRNAAYLRPVEAFDDAFDDLRYHQLAMLAGMRMAFEAMLQEFEPDRLQEQFDRQVKRGALLAVGSKLRYWDLYRDLHEQLVKDPEVTFRRLFGDAFAKAYEEQLERLKAQHARADSGNPPDEPER